MPFRDTNVVDGLPRDNKFQVGVSDVDSGPVIENSVLLPVPSDANATWLYYDCNVGVVLDSGIVIHNRLPQVNNATDTLGVVNFDDPKMDEYTGLGINLKCNDQYRDIVQRMGHARYWFRLWGMALRVGYQIPIPILKSVGGVPAIPYDKNPQWAVCGIAPGGNFSGVVLWRAQWSLWYTTISPPVNMTIPTSDPSAHISGVPPMPKGMQAPYSRPDDNAQPTGPIRKTV